MENNTKDRELSLTRMLNAPVELVWEVWTDPKHIANWWGPNGFTNTINKMDMRPDGEWDLVMHGPDGTDYKNQSIFKEVIPLKKIVYQLDGAVKFTATITFDARGEQTLLNWHMLFETDEKFTEDFIKTGKSFKVEEGLKQNVDKLEVYLAARI